MKKTIIILTILLFVFLNSVIAINICEDKVTPMQTCLILTPYITCSTYNYSVLDNNNNTVQSGTLENYQDNIYKFDFKQPKGKYLIKLCDNSTREIEVDKGENMEIAILIVGLVLFTIGIISKLYTKRQDTEKEATSLSLIVLGSMIIFVSGLLFVYAGNFMAGYFTSFLGIGLLIINMISLVKIWKW